MSIGCSPIFNSRRTRLQLSLLTCLPFNLTASLRERTPWKWKGLPPSLLRDPTGAQDLPESKRPRRSMPPDGGVQSSQPLLYGHISSRPEDQCSALLEQLRVRQSQSDIEREGRERDAALNCDSDPDPTVSGV